MVSPKLEAHLKRHTCRAKKQSHNKSKKGQSRRGHARKQRRQRDHQLKEKEISLSMTNWQKQCEESRRNSSLGYFCTFKSIPVFDNANLEQDKSRFSGSIRSLRSQHDQYGPSIFSESQEESQYSIEENDDISQRMDGDIDDEPPERPRSAALDEYSQRLHRERNPVLYSSKERNRGAYKQQWKGSEGKF